MTRPNLAGLAQDDRPLDAVLQFPNVARPPILPEHIFRLRRQSRRPLLELPAESVDEIACENRDVLPPVPKRWDRDGKDRQPKIQVLTELPRGDRCAEILVRRRHDPNINLQGYRTPNPLESSLLDRPQDLRLERERQITDLIKEERAAVGHLELAWLSGNRTGERSLLISEQLRLQQRFRNRGAVDRHERAINSATERMQSAGEQFLAGSALAAQQDGRIA